MKPCFWLAHHFEQFFGYKVNGKIVEFHYSWKKVISWNVQFNRCINCLWTLQLSNKKTWAIKALFYSWFNWQLVSPRLRGENYVRETAVPWPSVGLLFTGFFGCLFSTTPETSFVMDLIGLVLMGSWLPSLFDGVTGASFLCFCSSLQRPLGEGCSFVVSTGSLGIPTFSRFDLLRVESFSMVLNWDTVCLGPWIAH